MHRNTGMRLLLGAFEYMFASGCLLGMNMILMLVFGLLRNLPTLLKSGREILRDTLIWAYQVYRPILEYLHPLAARYLSIELAKNPVRCFATGFLSLLIHLTTWLIFGWHFSVVWLSIAVLHGTIVGLLWDELDQPDGLHMGERIE